MRTAIAIVTGSALAAAGCAGNGGDRKFDGSQTPKAACVKILGSISTGELAGFSMDGAFQTNNGDRRATVMFDQTHNLAQLRCYAAGVAAQTNDRELTFGLTLAADTAGDYDLSSAADSNLLFATTYGVDSGTNSKLIDFDFDQSYYGQFQSALCPAGGIPHLGTTDARTYSDADQAVEFGPNTWIDCRTSGKPDFTAAA